MRPVAAQVLVYGQQGDVVGVATNPKFPHIFATAGHSNTVMVWNSQTRKVRASRTPPASQGLTASDRCHSVPGPVVWCTVCCG